MRVRRVVTTRAGGRSTGPFARFNLSVGVGDDPVAVAANRRRLTTELGVRECMAKDRYDDLPEALWRYGPAA